MVLLPKRLRKNLLKTKNFKKFTIFIEWLELVVGKKVLVLAERLRKKDASGNLYKSTTENISFFNREEIFIVRKVFLKEDSYNYWISKTADGEIINKRFLWQELFALKNQFD